MLQEASKYITIAEVIVCSAGPIKNYFANKNHQRAEVRVKKFVDLISRDITISITNGVSGSNFKTKRLIFYIGNIKHFHLCGNILGAKRHQPTIIVLISVGTNINYSILNMLNLSRFFCKSIVSESF